MKIGEVKLVMTFVGGVEVTCISETTFKAETTRGNHMAKATDARSAVDFLLRGVSSSLITETLNYLNL